MSSPSVHTIILDEPLVVVGKTFEGDYANAPHYVTDVQNALAEASIEFVPNKVFGIYYDNPQQKKPEELTSFQGVFINDENAALPAAFEKLKITGKFLYVKMKGEPMKSIYEGYGALFNNIQKNQVKLKSPVSYQLSAFENGEITTEIYMEID